ncbi:MAG TPA: TonB family protein [Thermoanaerobaculia bacterium]|nr:TonB family protein [Thermoanaerobaculia bacterium]
MAAAAPLAARSAEPPPAAPSSPAAPAPAAPPGGRQPLAEMVKMDEDLKKVHELLAAQSWAAAGDEAHALLAVVAPRVQSDPATPAAVLGFLAIAAAGQGDRAAALCRWEAAQSLFPRLESADLSAYGTAAKALLDSAREHPGKVSASRGKASDPEPVATPAPGWTKLARVANLQGKAVVEAVIDTNGRIRHPKIAQSLGMGLDVMALDGICDWRFKPASVKGKPIAVQYSLDVKYSVVQ